MALNGVSAGYLIAISLVFFGFGLAGGSMMSERTLDSGDSGEQSGP